MKINHNNYFQSRNKPKLIWENKPKSSVGCIVVNNSVISSGVTSLGGRPHTE